MVCQPKMKYRRSQSINIKCGHKKYRRLDGLPGDRSIVLSGVRRNDWAISVTYNKTGSQLRPNLLYMR